MEPLTTHRSDVAVIEQGFAWHAEGVGVVLATVAHTWGSSPRPVGSVMALAADGRFAGSVSGGCIEDDLLQTIKSGWAKPFEVLEYDSNETRSLPCGGLLLLTLENLGAIDDLETMLAYLREGGSVVRCIDLENGSASWEKASANARTQLEKNDLQVVYAPSWRLLICGAGELAQWVCRLALLMDYAVAVCDPREDYRQAWTVEGVGVSAEYPDDFLRETGLDERSAVVALTHDPKIDDLAVLESLASQAFYVGALGSRRTTNKRAERLQEHFGCSAEELARVSGPIGIDLNSRKPQEIALSVLTEITARRNGVCISTVRHTVE